MAIRVMGQVKEDQGFGEALAGTLGPGLTKGASLVATLGVAKKKADLAQGLRDIKMADKLDLRMSTLANDMEKKQKGSFGLASQGEGLKKTLDAIKKYRPDRFTDDGKYIPLPASRMDADGFINIYKQLEKKKGLGEVWSGFQTAFMSIFKKVGPKRMGEVFDGAIKDDPQFKENANSPDPAKRESALKYMLTKMAKVMGFEGEQQTQTGNLPVEADPFGLGGTQ